VDAARAAETPAAARRIVSLVPSVTEMLFAIGAGPQVVGVSTYDRFPEAVRALPRVGALLDPDTEKVLSLKPDLVVLYGSQTDVEQRIGRAGIRVFSYRHGGLADTMRAMRDVGRETGHATEADRAASEVERRIARVRTRVGGRPRPRVMLVVGRDEQALRGVFASGGVGFLHEMLDAAGGANVFADVPREALQPSTETMLARAPDVILEVHSGTPPPTRVLARERAVWQALSSIPAVRQHRVELLYGSELVSPGPRLAQATEVLARVLHPEVFGP
jgi:iron complex transport system substrate-binding protein